MAKVTNAKSIIYYGPNHDAGGFLAGYMSSMLTVAEFEDINFITATYTPVGLPVGLPVIRARIDHPKILNIQIENLRLFNLYYDIDGNPEYEIALAYNAGTKTVFECKVALLIAQTRVIQNG